MAVEVCAVAGLLRLAKRAARAVECAEDVFDAAAPLGRSVCVVCVGSGSCCPEGVGTSGGDSGGAVGAGADGLVSVMASGVISGGSGSASSFCSEPSVCRSVGIESTILSLGVGIISERMSSPSVLASSSSSLIAT